jgi:hypothetical protein
MTVYKDAEDTVRFQNMQFEDRPISLHEYKL